MAVAKCHACGATATVLFEEGVTKISSGDSFLTKCKGRSRDQTQEDPSACATMGEAIGKAERRAEAHRRAAARLAAQQIAAAPRAEP